VVYRSIFKADLFAGQVVVVTGGGSGIGRCTAHELASLGAQVVVIGRNEGRLHAVCDEIAAVGGRCSYGVADIRDEVAVQASIADIVRVHGRLDALVNNARGAIRRAAAEDIR
jgi:citronellol/citronellal dehydrogenase